MASFKPYEILPPMQWQIFSTVLHEISQSDISALASTLFDKDKGQELTSERLEALNSIELSAMKFIDHPDSAEIEVKTETHSIRFSNRTSTRGELRGELLKKVLQQYKSSNPSWTLNKTLLVVATSLETNSSFNYLTSSWRSTPDLSLDKKDIDCLIHFSHYCYSQIKKDKKLNVEKMQNQFNKYYYDYNQLHINLDKLNCEANIPLRLFDTHLSNFLSAVLILKEINIDVGNSIEEILISWQSALNDFFCGNKSFVTWEESYQEYFSNIKENLKKIDSPLFEATEQLREISKSLNITKWVRLWNICVEAYLKGNIPLQEFKKDSAIFHKELVTRYPQYKEIMNCLHSTIIKTTPIPKLNTSSRYQFYKPKSLPVNSNTPETSKKKLST